MGNRDFKLKLWQTNPRCHWCGRETKLINVPEIKGHADPLMATVDHLISRYNPERWVRRNQTKVLACYECNTKRSQLETRLLSKEELVRRGQGFSLNPRGKPIFSEALDTLDAVLDKMKEHGIIPFNERGTEQFGGTNGVCGETTGGNN